MEVTVRVEWDMGHRLPNHGGPCRNLHGHRYVADVSLAGPVAGQRGAADEGMVLDFSLAKEGIRHEVAKVDHRFLVCDGDPYADRMAELPGVVLVSFVPTAENIARALLRALRIRSWPSGVDVARLRLYETPTSWADVEAADL